MSDELKGKVVLIAGATGDLGSAVTHEFAQTEARLVVTSRSIDALHDLVAETGLSEERVVALEADVRQAEDVDALVQGVVDRFGRLDVLLNAVGGWSRGATVAETTVEAWEHMLDLNLRTAYLLSRAVLPHMLEEGWGRIVHVGHKLAVEPRPKLAGLAVSKMGVITLTQVIAAEVKGTGVTANVIVPSILDTPANRSSLSKADPAKWVPPEHVAATMRFLCSDAAASINGVSLPMYGAV